MIPENVPAVTYTGNGEATEFDFDFLVEDSAKLIVELTTDVGTILRLQYGVDYSVVEFNNPIGSRIIYPIEGSEHTILSANEKISLYLTLPAEQMSEYSKSSEMDFKLLEYSFDYLTRLIQILFVQIEHCARLPIGSKENVQDLINQLANGNTLAQKWAEWMDGTVDGFGYSAKYHAEEAAANTQTIIEQGEQMLATLTEEADVIINQANSSANRAEEAAQKCIFGMQWFSFTQQDWTLNVQTNKNELVYENIPIINSVYNGTWENKQLVAGVDIIVTDTECRLISLNAFNGFALSNANIIGKYTFPQETANDIWVIEHNLGHIPRIIVMNDDNIEITCTREHPTFNKTILYFETPQTGIAYLN